MGITEETLNRPLQVSVAILNRGQILWIEVKIFLKVREIQNMFANNCSVSIMFHRTFQTILTTNMKIYSLFNMATVTEKGHINISSVMSETHINDKLDLLDL